MLASLASHEDRLDFFLYMSSGNHVKSNRFWICQNRNPISHYRYSLFPPFTCIIPKRCRLVIRQSSICDMRRDSIRMQVLARFNEWTFASGQVELESSIQSMVIYIIRLCGVKYNLIHWLREHSGSPGFCFFKSMVWIISRTCACCRSEKE